ncbi:zinc ribbon domain-containing protein, partial [Staphylococcus epidermidis]
EIEEGTLSATGSGLSKMFDIQHNNFKTITCTNCGYTEFYKESANRTSDFIDLFFGG